MADVHHLRCAIGERNRGQRADEHAARRVERQTGRHDVRVGQIDDPGDRAVGRHAEDLAAVRVVDPQRARRWLGDDRVATAIGIGVTGDGRHRILAGPRRQVGDQLGAAVADDSIDARRLVRVAVTWPATVDTDVQLAVEIGDVLSTEHLTSSGRVPTASRWRPPSDSPRRRCSPRRPSGRRRRDR